MEGLARRKGDRRNRTHRREGQPFQLACFLGSLLAELELNDVEAEWHVAEVHGDHLARRVEAEGSMADHCIGNLLRGREQREVKEETGKKSSTSMLGVSTRLPLRVKNNDLVVQSTPRPITSPTFHGASITPTVAQFALTLPLLEKPKESLPQPERR